MHVVPYDIYTNTLFESIASHTPSLTHLHFSGIQRRETFFVTDLEVAFGTREESPVHSGLIRRLPTARLLSSVQKVFMKPAGPPAHTEWCGTHAADYEDLLQDLYILNGKEDRLVLLKEQDKLTESLQHDDETDWLNRVAGGEGCWSVDERIPKEIT